MIISPFGKGETGEWVITIITDPLNPPTGDLVQPSGEKELSSGKKKGD